MFNINEISAERWYVLSVPQAGRKAHDTIVGEMKKRAESSSELRPVLDYFVPMLDEKTLVNHELKNKPRPFCFNYVFIKGSLNYIWQFRETYPTFNLLRDRGRETGYLFVPDKEMEMFRFIVNAYNGHVPYFAADKKLLEAGDRVRVIGGQFKGIEGTLITRRGKDGGRVALNVCNRIAVPTLDIEPENLEIIAFAGDQRHLYLKLDSYHPRIRLAIRHFWLDGSLDTKDKEAIELFLRRYGKVEVESEKIRGRYLAYLLMSHLVLQHKAAVDYYIRECTAHIRYITNTVTRAFIFLALYAATNDDGNLKMAKSLATDWDSHKLSAKQRQVLEDIRMYEKE